MFATDTIIIKPDVKIHTSHRVLLINAGETEYYRDIVSRFCISGHVHVFYLCGSLAELRIFEKWRGASSRCVSSPRIVYK